MKPILKLAIGACVVLVIGLGSLAYRRNRVAPVAPDPADVLTAVQPEDGGSEPGALPTAPILKNRATEPGRLSVDFGYRIGTTSYAYRLAMGFAADADAGTVELGAVRTRADGGDTFPATRRWSQSRQAYLVAVAHNFADASTPIPNLCLRAVLGSSKATLDLQTASLCVMQRDVDGRCHPTTLACGLIR